VPPVLDNYNRRHVPELILSILALFAALLAQHARPPVGRQALLAFYGRMCLSAAKRLNAGDRNSGILAWIALMGAVLIPVALVAALAAAIHPLVLWILEVAFLYGTLRFFSTTRNLGAIERALRNGDSAAAASQLGLWRAEPLETDDPAAIARLAAEHGLCEAHQGTFAPLFWYLVLPGPLGLVIYPLALRAALSWEHFIEAGERDFGWFAARAFHVLDWIPQRVSAFIFAVAGNFEDAMYCWRSQATLWSRPEEGIVVASGAGAIGIRLGEVGQGEAPREDALASLEGMLWRVLVVWLIVFLLAAALQGA
jgi:adenosylcobinamide-phosphate synthase